MLEGPETRHRKTVNTRRLAFLGIDTNIFQRKAKTCSGARFAFNGYVMGVALSDYLVGRMVVDTTCLNAALVVARLTFSVSRRVFSLPLLLLATRKEECGRSS